MEDSDNMLCYYHDYQEINLVKISKELRRSIEAVQW